MESTIVKINNKEYDISVFRTLDRKTEYPNALNIDIITSNNSKQISYDDENSIENITLMITNEDEIIHSISPEEALTFNPIISEIIGINLPVKQKEPILKIPGVFKIATYYIENSDIKMEDEELYPTLTGHKNRVLELIR